MAIKPTKPLYEFGPFCLDPVKRHLSRDGATVPLTRKAFDTLLLLVRNCGQVLEKDEMMKILWPDTIVEEANLTQNIFTLRKTLGESPDEHKFIETIPRRGYRFVASVKQTEHEGVEAMLATYNRSSAHTMEEEANGEDSNHGELKVVSANSEQDKRTRRRTSRTLWAVSVVLVGLAIALSYFWIYRKSTQPEVLAGHRSIAVLPFKPMNAGDGDEYLGLGMADALITKLSNMRQIVVRPTSAVRKYSVLEQDPVLTGRDLGVESVMEGSVQRLNERIRVTVQLINVRDGRPQWAEKFDEKFTDIFSVQDLISEKVAAALALKLTSEERKLLTKRYTDNSEAYELFLRGHYEWNRFTPLGLKKSIEYYNQAISIDPSYGLAYSALAASYGVQGNTGLVPPSEAYPKAKLAAEKAVEFDTALAEIHAPMGPVKLFYEWDWVGAEREFKRVLEFNPNFSHAHLLYGYYLGAMGRIDEAKAETKRARGLEPLSPVMNKGVGITYYFAREHDAAIEESKRALGIDSNFLLARLLLGQAYEQKGMYDQAIAEFQMASSSSKRDPAALASLGHAYAASGKRHEAQKMLGDLKVMSKQRYVSPYNIALIYTGLGEKHQALTWLEKSYEARDYRLIWLKVEPQFDSLRSDPRFADLLRRMGLAA